MSMTGQGSARPIPGGITTDAPTRGQHAVHVGMKWGIAGGVVAGLGAIAWSEDRLFNRGPATGAIVPVTLGGAALGTLALGVAARGGWRWTGSPVLSSLSHATGPIALAALGGALGVGAAALFDQVFPASDGANPSKATAAGYREQAGKVDAAATQRDAKIAAERQAANTKLDGALEQLDTTLEANGGRLGAAGTVGEGRLDVTGLSPEQAANLVFEAYAPGGRELTNGIVRVDGQNVFSLPWITKENPIDRAELTEIFTKLVDTAEPKGTLSADEARRWQVGEHRETRSRETDGGAG